MVRRGGVVAAVLLLALSACSSRSSGPVGEQSAGDDASEQQKDPAGRDASDGEEDKARSGRRACRSPDCTLRDAAVDAGVSIGVHIEVERNPEGGALSEPSDEELALAAREFDRVSVIGVSAGVMQPRRGEFAFADADQMYRFAQDHGLSMHAYHWLWSQDQFDLNPPWLEVITDGDEMWRVLEDHLATIVDRYPDLDRINAVNEPMAVVGGARAENLFAEVLGPDYVTEAFRRADAIAPNYELFLNEVLVEYDEAKAEGLVDLVTDVLDAGAPLDGVGIQGHLLAGEPDWDLLERLLRDLDRLGVKVAITELDAPVEPELPDRADVQAERMARVVELCLSVEACDSVIVWGLHDGLSWLNTFMRPGLDPLLFNEDLEPKPAYDAVRQTLLDQAGT